MCDLSEASSDVSGGMPPLQDVQTLDVRSFTSLFI